MTFGVSGRLYKSNVLLYDHQSESLWSQLMEKAITGPMAGKILREIPSVRVKWRVWKKRNKDTLVLSDKTGFIRDYSINPYKGYYRLGRLMFPVGNVRKDLSPKVRVLGIHYMGNAKAYRVAEINKKEGVIQDKIGDVPIQIFINNDREIINVTDDKGHTIPYLFSYWFAWQAFHPKTLLYKSD